MVPGRTERAAAGLQGGVLWTGVVGAITSQGGGVIPMLLLLGAVFTGLWWAALRLGRAVERARTSQSPPA